jgi:uncharacterized membrane protein YeiB
LMEIRQRGKSPLYSSTLECLCFPGSGLSLTQHQTGMSAQSIIWSVSRFIVNYNLWNNRLIPHFTEWGRCQLTNYIHQTLLI